jgi:iron complex outermembrane receptor protein
MNSKNYFLLIILVFSLWSNSTVAQRLIKGVIVDAESSIGIKNVTITINDGKLKSQSDKEGKFKIVTMSDSDTVKFFHDRYYSEYTILGDAQELKVDLTKLDQSKNVEVGYGNLDNRSLTTSTATLEEKDFNKGNNNDIYALLRGKIPGLIVKHNVYNPNEKPLIMLRGPSNFNQNVEPLIVVNGVTDFSLNSVDPNDVESVTVLKDSSAQAIYGSRGAAGVIIIKTKKGKSN